MLQRPAYSVLVALTIGALSLACATPTATPSRFGGGSLSWLESARVDSLKAILKADSLDSDRLLHEYFGDLYDPDILDWVVYLPRVGPAKHALVHDRKEKDELDGEESVWVIVFSEIDLGPRSGDTTSIDLRVSIEGIEHTHDPLLTALVKSLGTFVLGAETPTSGRHAAQDSTINLTLSRVARERAPQNLWVAMGRLPLSEQTTNRISLSAGPNRSLSGDRSVNYYFGNKRRSLFGVSIAAGATFNAARPRVVEKAIISRDHRVRPAIYLMGQLFFKKPAPPWDPWGVAFTVGTNITSGDSLDDVVAGVRISGLEGIGFTAGINYLKWGKARQGLDAAGTTPITFLEPGRDFRPFLAVDVAF